MENVYYTALYKVAKRLDFLLDFCIVKNREKNLVVWPRLNRKSTSYTMLQSYVQILQLHTSPEQFLMSLIKAKTVLLLVELPSPQGSDVII